jgi:putative methyltransferase (TIGR04325 family)
MSVVKSILKDWLPPVFLRLVKGLTRVENRYVGNYKNWDDAAALCIGYDAQSILDKVLQAALKVKNNEAVFERDSVIFDEIHYSWPVTAALMWVAAKNNGKLHVLDFGGSLGSTYYQNRKFLSKLEVISWSVVEQAHFVDVGKKYIEDETIKFYSSVQDSVDVQLPNVIIFSSVIQYVSNLEFLFEQINSFKKCVLIFDRTPFSNLSQNKICIQYVSSRVYEANYPMWILSKARFFSQLENWRLIEEFACSEGAMRSSSGVTFDFTGCILEYRYD